MISSPIDEIKNRLDIVEVVGSYIKLQKAGANYRALCPFHSEKKPSFFVSPSRQIWHCFGGCSTGGDIFKFIMRIEGVEFGDALRILAKKAGVELKRQDPQLKSKRQRLYELCQWASLFFEKQLGASRAGAKAKEYLKNRGINEQSIKKWRLGYAPDSWQGLSDFLVGKGYSRQEIAKAGLALKSEKTGNYYDRFRARIIFPIFDLNSQVVGFGGRIFKQSQRPDAQEEAKYINSPATLLYDKSRILYGLDRAKVEIRKKNSCILVEGYVDAIMVSQAGFENVVATSGTALTPFQLRILKRYSQKLLTAFDMDLAGGSATKRGIDLAQSQGFDIKVVMMPKDSDPADIIFQDSQNWQNLVQNSKSIHDFYFETTFSQFDKNTLEGKKEISKIILPAIKRIPNRIEQSFWIHSLAESLGVREEDVIEELNKLKTEQLGPSPEEFSYSGQPEKSRKELLEEQITALVLKHPELFPLLEKEGFSLFSPKISKVLVYFKEKGADLVSAGAEIEPELLDFLNYLSLKGEIETEDLDWNKEFENCLKEIKTIDIKSKLDKISQEIKRAEAEKNLDKIQTLVQQFDGLCQSLQKLNN